MESKDGRLVSIDLITIPYSYYLRVTPTQKSLPGPNDPTDIHPSTQNQKELRGVGFD